MRKIRRIEKIALYLLGAAMIFLNLDTMVYAQGDPQSTFHKTEQGIELYQHHLDVGPYCVLVNDILLTEEETEELLQSTDKESLLLQKTQFLLRKKPNYKTIKADSTNVQVDISEIVGKALGRSEIAGQARNLGDRDHSANTLRVGHSALDAESYEIKFETTQGSYTIRLNSKVYATVDDATVFTPTPTAIPTAMATPKSTNTPKPTKTPKATATPKPTDVPVGNDLIPTPTGDVIIIPPEVYVDNGSHRSADPTATVTPTITDTPVENDLGRSADPIPTPMAIPTPMVAVMTTTMAMDTPTDAKTRDDMDEFVGNDIGRFALEHSYVAIFSLSGVFLVSVGMSIFLDIKAIIWYKRKRKENRDKRCQY